MTLQSPYHLIELKDCACPSFCSFTKPFHGRLSDIKGLMEALAGDNEKGCHDEILDAFRAWEQGTSEVTHKVTYRECRLLTAEELIACEDRTFENVIWKHTNIWDVVYELKAESIDVSQIVVKQEDRYIRCIRPVFENLMVRTPDAPIARMRQWRPVGDRFWGYPHMMVLQGRYTYPRLFMEQGHFFDPEEALRDLKDETKIDFAVVMEELFGDG